MNASGAGPRWSHRLYFMFRPVEGSLTDICRPFSMKRGSLVWINATPKVCKVAGSFGPVDCQSGDSSFDP